MALTSQQKHYLKKNYRRFSIEKMAADLNADQKEIESYLKRQFKYYFQTSHNLAASTAGSSFLDIKSFFFDNRFFIIGLFVIVILVYANSFDNGFVSDDIPTLANNPSLKDGSFVFTSFVGLLRFILLYIVYLIFGIHEWAFRGLNIFFHLSSTILVFAIAYIISSERKPLAMFTALFFATHPILIESVTWISGGPYSQGGFFFLSAILLYIIRSQNKYYYYLSLLFFTCAFFSSEKTITLPLVLFLYEFTFGNLKGNWKKLIPYFLIQILFASILLLKIKWRIAAIGGSFDQASYSINPFFQIPVALFSYLKLLFYPRNLSLYQTELEFNFAQLFGVSILFLLFIAVIVYSYKKNRLLFFWLSFMLITLLPTILPLKVAWIVAERYIYLGSIGIFFAVAMLFDYLYKNPRYKTVALTAFVIIIGALSIRTIYRNMDWQNEDTLWIATGKTSPSGKNIHNNLGDVYARQGNFEKSIEEFKRAIEIDPNYADAFHNLGNTYLEIGRYDDALPNFEKALSINPLIWQSHTSLASIYFEKGDYPKAKDHLLKALELQPQNPTIQNNLKLVEEKM